MKKGQTLSGTNSSHNGKHHHLSMDTGSSGADSDIKVEIRTTSSMSQHWPDDTDQRCADSAINTEMAQMAQVVENIYSYSTNPSLNYFPSVPNVISV